MNKAFEKIVERLEEKKSIIPVNRLLDDIIKDKPKELGQLMAYNNSIKIVQEVAEEYESTEYINCSTNDSTCGWIPCSSGKLPKEYEDVEVTIEEIANDVGGKRYYTMRSWLQDGQWVIKKNPYHPTVTAWKYPTDPYKEREQNG